MMASSTCLSLVAMILVMTLKNTLQRAIGRYWSTLDALGDLGMRARNVWL